MSTSVVVFDPVTMTTRRSSKLRPTPTQKRSSRSRNTSTSSDVGVPTRWRHTAQGRHASSSSTQNTQAASGVRQAPPMAGKVSGSSTGWPSASVAVRSRSR